MRTIRGFAPRRRWRPGPEQWAAIRALDAGALSHHDRLVVVELIEQCKAALDADEQPAYAGLAHGDPDRDGDRVEWVCDELALATRYSATTCGSRMTVGRALVERFPGDAGVDGGRAGPGVQNVWGHPGHALT